MSTSKQCSGRLGPLLSTVAHIHFLLTDSVDSWRLTLMDVQKFSSRPRLCYINLNANLVRSNVDWMFKKSERSIKQFWADQKFTLLPKDQGRLKILFFFQKSLFAQLKYWIPFGNRNSTFHLLGNTKKREGG